ncbi:hypothetical protein PWT90_06368 [Aphanocladium album]|nr:hypothetical protein PWT90_06368 [Aphanocladium album]
MSYRDDEQDRPLADDEGWSSADETAALLGGESEQSSASPFTQKITVLDIAAYISYMISMELGQSFSANALHQVVEENLCREMYGRTDAKFCGAADDVQSEHAVLMGWYRTAQLVPGFWPSIFPIHIIWIAPLLYFIGGGIDVSNALLFANLTGLTTDAARFKAVLFACFFVEPKSFKKPATSSADEDTACLVGEEPIALAKGQLKARVLSSLRQTKEGFSYVMGKCNSHVIRVALCLVAMTLAWQTNLSDEIMRRKFGWTWSQLSYLSVTRMMVTLMSSLILLPGASLSFGKMEDAFPEYPTGFGRQDLLSRGTSGLIVVDRRTQTVIKWPVDARTSYGIQQERKTYEKLLELGGHEGILTYHGGVERYGLRLEYAAVRDLRSHIRYKGIGSPLTLQWMVQIARALDFIHDAGVIHGSISLTHVVLDMRGNARICDFAWASLRSRTLLAQAFASHEYPGDRLSVAGDLFAFGSVMYELVTGSEPFVTCTDDEIRLRFKNGMFPDVASLGTLGMIISNCWAASYANTKDVVGALEDSFKTDKFCLAPAEAIAA